MVNAPPTPPPTTATELQDQSRSRAQAAPPNPPPSAGLDSFPPSFPAIVDFASKAQYLELIRIAEETDILASTSRQPSRLYTVCPLVLSYLILDNVCPAQYALARLPDVVVSLPLTKALSNLVNATAERQYAKIYPRAEFLLNFVSQPDSLDGKLASLIANLVANFLEAFRLRTFALLCRAYSSLPLSLAEVYLGLPGDQIIRVAEEQSWTYSAPSQILEPKMIPRTVPSAPTLPTSSLSTLRFIADSVGELEA